MKNAVLIDQAIFSFGTLANTLLLARILSIADFASYSLCILILFLYISVLNSLIIQPMQIFISRVDNKKNYLLFINNLYTFFSIALSLLNTAIFGVYIGLFSFLFLWHDYARKLFLSQNSIKKVLIIDTSNTILQIVGLSVFWLLGESSFELTILFVSWSYFLTLFFKFPYIESKSVEKQFYIQHIAQGKWLLMTTFVQWGASNFFVLMATIYIEKEASGIFRLMQSIFGVLNIILQTFENHTLPAMGKIYQKSKKDAYLYLKETHQKYFLLFFAFILFIWIYPNDIISIIAGNKYQKYAFILQGMCILYAIIFITYPIKIALRIEMMDKIFFLGYVISFLFSIFSFQYLLSNWHLLGAVIGLASNQIIITIIWRYYLIKKTSWTSYILF